MTKETMVSIDVDLIRMVMSNLKRKVKHRNNAKIASSKRTYPTDLLLSFTACFGLFRNLSCLSFIRPDADCDTVITG